MYAGGVAYERPVSPGLTWHSRTLPGERLDAAQAVAAAGNL